MIKRGERRQQILEVLAAELETQAGSRITTAHLAAAVGVSEAALYRHFASKAQMFEGLIAFAEDTIFGLFNRIMEEQKDVGVRCFQLSLTLLRFAERNPGITRVLLGDILVGEHERLRTRVQQFFDRVETQFRQAMREARFDQGQSANSNSNDVGAVSALLVQLMVGRLDQFVRSDFQRLPTTDWPLHWEYLSPALFPRTEQ